MAQIRPDSASIPIPTTKPMNSEDTEPIGDHANDTPIALTHNWSSRPANHLLLHKNRSDLTDPTGGGWEDEEEVTVKGATDVVGLLPEAWQRLHPGKGWEDVALDAKPVEGHNPPFPACVSDIKTRNDGRDKTFTSAPSQPVPLACVPTSKAVNQAECSFAFEMRRSKKHISLPSQLKSPNHSDSDAILSSPTPPPCTFEPITFDEIRELPPLPLIKDEDDFDWIYGNDRYQVPVWDDSEPESQEEESHTPDGSQSAQASRSSGSSNSMNQDTATVTVEVRGKRSSEQAGLGDREEAVKRSRSGVGIDEGALSDSSTLYSSKETQSPRAVGIAEIKKMSNPAGLKEEIKSLKRSRNEDIVGKDAMIIAARCAAEKMTEHIWVSHAINFVVLGQSDHLSPYSLPLEKKGKHSFRLAHCLLACR